MHSSVVLVCLVVGTANYLFRYLPLRLSAKRQTHASKPGRMNRVLDSIGVASICSLLVLSSAPEIIKDSQRLLPTLVAFVVLALTFWKSKSIVLSTLIGAVCYGLMFKLMLPG